MSTRNVETRSQFRTVHDEILNSPWVIHPSQQKDVFPFSTNELFFGPKKPGVFEVLHIESNDGMRRKTIYASAGPLGMNLFEIFCMDTLLSNGMVRQHVCAPLSVGCAGGCTPCEVGDFFVQNIHPADIVGAIQMSLQERKWDYPTRLLPPKVMMLGGGEIGFYPKALELLERFRLSSPLKEAEIIISTVGVDTATFTQVEEFVARDSLMNLQVSVGSLDDQLRDQIMPHPKRLSVGECITLCGSYASRSGKKPHLSLFMLEGVDTPQTVLQQVQKLVPTFVHITLTDIVGASDRLRLNSVSEEKYGETARLLQARGYAASVYCPALDPTLNDSCGLLLPGTPELVTAIKGLNFSLRHGDVDDVVVCAYSRLERSDSTFQVGDTAFEQIKMRANGELRPFSRIGIVVDRRPLPERPENHLVTILTVAATEANWRNPGMVDRIESLY